MGVADPVYFPGGVADPDARAGYVTDGAGIVAVGLRDGERLWRTERAIWPLISDGERLAGASIDDRRPNVVEVVVLDRDRGELLLACDPAVLPEWVTAAPERREAFRMSARVEGDRLWLEWEAHARYGGGAPPPAHIRREAEHDAAGSLEVDLESGTVSPLAVAHRGDDREAIRRPPMNADDLTAPWLAGTAVVRLVWEVDDSEQSLALETDAASTADGGRLVELARGEGLVAQVTREGRHVFVHQEPAPAGRDAWWVFSAPSGRRVATLVHDAGASSPEILADRVYYLLEGAGPERALRARELGSGALAWEAPLTARQTSGPLRLRQ
jgi:hypothetical protein